MPGVHVHRLGFPTIASIGKSWDEGPYPSPLAISMMASTASRGDIVSDKIWANSGDSHFIEPAGLWHEMMPKALADRMPRSERMGDDEERDDPLVA